MTLYDLSQRQARQEGRNLSLDLGSIIHCFTNHIIFMSVRILKAETGEQVIYDSVTMTAFGVVHENQDYDLEDFLEWLSEDARKYTQVELNDLYYEWLKRVQGDDNDERIHEMNHLKEPDTER